MNQVIRFMSQFVRPGPRTKREYTRLKYRHKTRCIIRGLSPESAQAFEDAQHRDPALPDYTHTYSSVNGIVSDRYVSEEDFYAGIEPSLNPPELALAHQDKNLYDLTPIGPWCAVTVARRMGPRWFDSRYVEIDPRQLRSLLTSHEVLVKKPSVDSSQARGVLIASGDEVAASIANDNRAALDLIIQERVDQSNLTARFHPASLNTFRVVTARVGRSPIMLSTIFRIGTRGRPFDNKGIFVGVERSGRLRDFACDLEFRRLDRHPDSGLQFDGVVISEVGELVETCESLHRYLPHFGMVSWDMALDRQGRPVVIELNLRYQEINFHQCTNGPVLALLKT